MLRRSWVATLVALVGVCLGTPARAGNPSLNTQLFRPSALPGHYLQTRGVDLPRHLTFSGALALHYASDPLVFVSANPTGSGERSHAVVSDQLTMDLLLSASFFERLGIGIALPLFLFQGGQDGGFVPFASYDSFAVGDLRVSPYVVLLRHRGRGVGLGVDLTVHVPTAQDGRFAGDGGVGFAPRFVVEVAYPSVRGALNLGVLVRENQRFVGLTARDQLRLDAAVAVPLWRGGIEAFGELQLATAAADPFGAADENQLEARLGLGHRFASGWFLRGAAGGGMLDGWGTPSWRVVVMAGYAGAPDRGAPISGFRPERRDDAPTGDGDRDGIVDRDDRCPDVPEDRDGFQDADGCPDPDNDGDGVPDSADRCPDEAEDRDGFRDGDGCPDSDNDADGIPDAADRCPDEAETPNGVDDADGCPDGFPIRIEGERIVMDTPIRFAEPGRRSPNAASLPALRGLARFLTDHPELERVRIEAHTDAEGEADRNRALTQAQAEAVRDLLVSYGVPAIRLEAVGYGETRPIAPNTEAWGREENRRVEFVILRR